MLCNPSVLPSVIIKALKEHKNLFEEGIPIPSNACWTDIAKTLNNVLTPKHLYTIVKNNRYNVRSELTDTLDISIENASSNNSDIEESEEVINFNITLSMDEWKKLGLTTKEYSRNEKNGLKRTKRKYHVFEAYNWTNIIHQHFYGQTGIPCRIAYKRVNIHPEGSVYVNIFGSCSSCKSIFSGKIENEPGENSLVVIQCKYQGMYNACSGKNKRRLIGRRRDELKNKLIKENQSASYIQRMEAKDIMRFGQKEPSHIPSLNALRLLKSKELQSENLNNDPIISISILKKTNNFNTVIRDIGYDRFFVHYWSGAELNVYRQYIKKNIPSTISIDATGGIVQRPILISGRKTSNIFLYEVVVMDHVIKRQYGVAHMLSERHDTNSIAHWLQEWVKDGAPIPKIVVMDQSLALMSAAVKSFTQYASLNMYLEVCSAWILGNCSYSLPTTMIRNDFNHLMKLLSSWPEFKTSTYRIKNFYLRSIALLIQSKDFKEIKSLLKSVFVVALFETEGLDEITGDQNLCEIHKMKLKTKIASIESTPIDTINDESLVGNLLEIPTEVDVITSSEPEYFRDIKSLYENCVDLSKKYDHGDRDNHQHNIKIANRLLQFCKLLPCWTAVMVPFYGCGNITQTSASSESQFNDLKNRVFKHTTLPLRVDRFLTTHINSFTGTMNLVASDMNDHESFTKVNEKNLQTENQEIIAMDYEYDENENNNEENAQLVDEDTVRVDRLVIKETENIITKLNKDKNQHNMDIDFENDNCCIACINSHMPTGAHKCYLCNKYVHLIDGCSYGIPGEKEGFGEKRICRECFQSKSTHSELNAEENWRGESEKLKKRTNYAQKDPTILFYNDASNTKSSVIGVLKNGNRSNLKSVQIDGKYYITSNTCAFDSIVHVLCTSYFDSKPYAEYMNSVKENLLFKLVTNAVKDGINIQTYRKRVLILKDIFDLQELPQQLICIQADSTIEVMTRRLLENWPSRVDIQNCINCPHQQISQQPILVSINDIQNLNKLLLADGILNTCYNCNRRLINPYRYGEHIFIMTTPSIDFSKIPAKEITNDVQLVKNREAYVSGIQIKLQDIPKYIKIKRKVYKIRGAINLIKPSNFNIGNIGHYEAYCFRESTSQWELYDDLKNVPKKCRDNKIINAEIIIYTV